MRRTLTIFAFAISLFVSVASAQSRVIIRPDDKGTMVNAVADKEGRFVGSEIQAFSIVSIKIGQTPIALDQHFDAGADWLRALTVRIKNTSGQPIKAVRISFALPESKSDDRPMSGFSLEYGKELSTGIGYGEQQMIAPGEEVDIVRNDKHYERDLLGISQRTGMSDFTKVVLGNGQAILADGTSWISWRPEIAK